VSISLRLSVQNVTEMCLITLKGEVNEGLEVRLQPVSVQLSKLNFLILSLGIPQLGVKTVTERVNEHVLRA
jgi:hypothetical protein